MTDSSRTIVVVGSTGFIGHAVLTKLIGSGTPCTAVSRNLMPSPAPGVRMVAADLLDPRSLDAALDGADVVVHAASYTGPDPDQCLQVNEAGTLNLCAAASRHGITQILYVSTVGVYGPGPHRGIGEGEIPPNPVTALSVSRLAAEDIVRAHGGLALRAGFVHGTGDRWLLPGLVRILSTLGAWVDHGQSVLSTINVEDLGRLIAALAIRDLPPELRGGILHAADLEPMAVRCLAETAATELGLTLPTDSLTFTAALARAHQIGLTARQVDLVGRDHHYDSRSIWAYTCGP